LDLQTNLNLKTVDFSVVDLFDVDVSSLSFKSALTASVLSALFFLSTPALVFAQAAVTNGSRLSLPVPTAQSIKASCDRDLATAKALFKKIEAGKVAGDVFAQMNQLNMLIEDLSGPLYIISNVSPDKATRDAAEECTVKWSPLETEIYQSEALYKKIKAAKSSNPIQAAYQQELAQGFEDSGVSLPVDKRTRAKAIIEEITKHAKNFEKNVREDKTRVLVKADDLAGVPNDVFKDIKPGADGLLSLGLDYPTYLPVMENATAEATREKMWRAKVNEGSEANLALLDKITELRRELAGLYGYESYAAFTLRRKMARNPDTVLKFLASVKTQVTELEKSELAQLRTLKSELTNTAIEQTTVRRWDTAYLQEQMRRKRFSVNQEELRKHFPTEAAVKFMLQLSEKLYGVQFQGRSNVGVFPSKSIAKDKTIATPTWHPDVRVFDVSDLKTKKFIGTVYLDLFPREGKYNHAAVWPIRNASTLVGRTPIPVLVTNLNRTGLTQDEFETLLHEFGHALHGVLSVATYNAQAGTSVMRDFVEAPSQMFEEWARRPEPLQLFAKMCGGCPPLSDQQIEALNQSRKFGKGIQYARQWVYAAFDMALTHEKGGSSLEVWKRIEGATPLGHVEGTRFPAGFSHLVGGYAAGYYGYMWSEVIALDMLSAFGGQMLNEEVGRRYRNTILSQGGQKPPHALVEAFLGRQANSEAFFKEITGQR
jgi:thimet oligopeptidase